MDNYHKSLWLCGEQRQKIIAGKKQDETQFKVVYPVFRLTLLNLSNKVVDELFCGQELVGDWEVSPNQRQHWLRCAS